MIVTIGPEALVLEDLVRKALEVMPAGIFLIDQDRKIVWTHPEAALDSEDWPADVTTTLGELLRWKRPCESSHATQLTAACVREWELYLVRGAAGRNFVVCGNTSAVRSPTAASAARAPTPSSTGIRNSISGSS